MNPKLTEVMIEKLLEKYTALHRNFPIPLVLLISGEEVSGLLYEDGRFENKTTEELRALESKSEAGNSIS